MGRKKTVDWNEKFILIKNKMMDGLSIQQAIFECGYKSTTTIYNRLTNQQKKELLQIKLTMTTGRSHHIEDIRLGDRVTDDSDY